MATIAEYVAFGRAAILAILDREDAVVYQELIAKASDRQPPGIPLGVPRVDPHHVNTARQDLLREGLIVETRAASRGQRTITVTHPPLQQGNIRRVQDAAARKRALKSRRAAGQASPPPRRWPGWPRRRVRQVSCAGDRARGRRGPCRGGRARGSPLGPWQFDHGARRAVASTASLRRKSSSAAVKMSLRSPATLWPASATST